MKNNDCIFCQIAAGNSPSHTIWEDDRHIAFLSLHPNTLGFSVIITKEHYSSYLFELPNQVYLDLMGAAKKVALILDGAFETVGRTGCLIEGFGVNHAHVKLSPMHGTIGEWRPIKSKMKKYFDIYEGYISSHDHVRADDDALQKTAAYIRKFGNK